MSVEGNGVGHGGTSSAAEGPRLLNVVAIVVRRWRMVMAVTVCALLGAIGVIAVRRGMYTAQTVLIPSSPRQTAASQFLGGQFPGGLLGGSSSGQELVGVVARSRRLADLMAERLKGKVTPSEGRNDAIAKIREAVGKTELRSNPDGSIVILVNGEDPEVAALVANEYPVLLNEITTQLTAQSARRRQGFLEAQLAQARAQLEQSEQRLVDFQKGQNVPEIQDQARRTLDAATQLQQGIIEQELRVSQLQRTAGPENPDLRAARSELATRRAQLRRLTAGGDGSQLYPSLRESPQLKSNATRLLREFTKNEQVYLSLTAALADAQIESNRALPVVSVLDPALVPTTPAGPSAKIVIALALVMGVLLGVVAAFFREYAQHARRDPGNESFFIAVDEFKADVFRSRRKAGNGTHAGRGTGV